MFKNYLLTIFRQIQKNKLFTFINIFGLALGMAACLVIALYVNHHTSYDNFHQNGHRIFRLQSIMAKSGKESGVSVTSQSPLSKILKEQSPEIEQIARFLPYNYANAMLNYNGPKGIINEEQKGIYITESSVFDVFELKFIAGSPSTFDEPQKAIMTLENSQKFFDDPEKAIGEKFTINGNNGSFDYELIGIVEKFPTNSHIDFNLLISFKSMDEFTEARTNWSYNSMLAYILLKDPKSVDLIEERANEIFLENGKQIYEPSGISFDYFLQPLADIHISETNSVDFTESVDIQIMYALSLVAIIILVIAWINYMNLSLARTMERIKEMGVRMCMGSSKKQLTALFLMEALIMNMIAFGAALVIIQLLGDYIYDLTGLQLSLLADLKPLLFMTGLVIIGTVLIGFYPYFLLKTLRAVSVLTGGKIKTSKGIGFRKGLVFTQFMITCFLIAATLTVYLQINFMKNADLKIELENILVLKSPPTPIYSSDRENNRLLANLKTELLKYPTITDITSGGEIPGEFISWGTQLKIRNEEDANSVSTRLISMDYDYPEFFDINVIAGRALMKSDNPWSKGDVVINEKLSELLGFDNPQDAIGSKIDGFYAPLEVRGVLENHHHTSLHADFEPIAFIISGWTEYFFVKLQLDPNEDDQLASLNNQIDTIEKEWDSIFPNYPFDFFFLNTYFNEQYKQDERFGKLFTGFSTLAIVIACLGLFGLTSFTIQQRTKEIGIRKVLGAGFSNLMILLSREYLLLVGVASLITLPIAWWIMEKWLLDYSFRINIGWWFFVLPFLAILILSAGSIMFKVISSAQKNPVQSLRYE